MGPEGVQQPQERRGEPPPKQLLAEVLEKLRFKRILRGLEGNATREPDAEREVVE